jgi:hypothetical protein
VRWRLLKLKWSYGIGELFIVVVGVLIALAIEQWNSDRLDRVEEVEIIDRFIADLREDLEGVSRIQNILPKKKTQLQRIYDALESSDERPTDMGGFLADVVASTTQGWNQKRARRMTFDEMLSSGKFSLIRNTSIRATISDYYDFEANERARAEERETGYPDMSYQLVPRATEFELATDLSDDQLERIVDRVIDSSLRDHVVGEINFTQFLIEQYTSWKNRCLKLIDDLESYRSTIEQKH